MNLAEFHSAKDVRSLHATLMATLTTSLTT